MCVTVCLFHALLGCGIHVVLPQVYTCRRCLTDEGTVSVQMGPTTESRGILTDSHVSRDFIFVMFGLQFYSMCVQMPSYL